MLDAAQLKATISLSSIVQQAGVTLRRAGNGEVGLCPFHQERTPSFHVSEQKGVFHCFGCEASGDVFDFIQRFYGVDFLEAARMLGAGEIPSLPRTQGAKGTKASNLEGERQAREIWNAATNVAGTLAQLYLERRGLPLADIPGPLPLRFARLPHRDTSERHPCLVAAICNLDGVLTGVQRTFLAEDGHKLRDVTAKMSLGTLSGGAIRLGEFSAKLIVCEGLEDGLTLRMGSPDTPVWVAAGAGNMRAMQLPEACDEVIIAADNDEAGRRAATDAELAFRQPGRSIRLVSPPSPFKDFNELLQKDRST